MRKAVLAVVAATTVVLTIVGTAFAASPSSGSVGPSDTSTSWSGATFTAGIGVSPAACTAATCDHFTLSVAVPSSYWDTHTGSASVSIRWGDSADNFNLYVYRSGSLVGSSTSSSSSSEGVSFSNPSGTYSVVVLPVVVTAAGYSGSASFSSADKPTPPQPTSGGGGGGSGGGGGTGSGGGGGSGGGTGSGSRSGGSGTGSGSGTSGSGSGITGGGSTGSPSLPGSGFVPSGPPVSGNSSPGGLVVVPNGPIFNYHGPYYFKPPFRVAGSGGGKGGAPNVPTAPPRSAAPQPDQPDRGPQTSGRPARAAPIVVTPASHNPVGFPTMLWILLPIGLIALAAIGAVVFEPEETVQETGTGVAARTAAADPRTVRPPPGPLVLLGFGVRRVFRGIAGIAGGLFGADD